MTARRTPGQRAGLARPAVLAAAREILDEGGVDSLTMRELARRLGVAPNSVYSHVPGKAALVDELLDDVLSEVEDPGAGAEDPVAGLRTVVTSTFDVLVAHPGLVQAYLARQGARGPHARRLGDTMTALLARSGIPGTGDEVRVLVVHAMGFAALATAPTADPDLAPPLRVDEVRRAFLRGADWLLSGMAAAGGEAGTARQ